MSDSLYDSLKVSSRLLLLHSRDVVPLIHVFTTILLQIEVKNATDLKAKHGAEHALINRIDCMKER